MSVIHCSHCGTTNRAGSNFCNRCGTDLRDQGEDQPPQQQEGMPFQADDVDPDGAPPPVTAAEEVAQREDPDRRWRTRTDDRYRVDSNWAEGNRAESNRAESDHPWLSSEAEEDDFGDRASTVDTAAFPPEAQEQRSRRLVTGIQGLLDPIRISSTLGGEELAEQSQLTLPLLTIPAGQLRRIRSLVAEDPILLEHHLPPVHTAQVRLRLPWIITLLTLAVGIPLLLFFTAPVGEARQWPGVIEAYAAIDALPAESQVWILWAYDPTTAGEMDLVALAMASHLIERQAQATVISLLPTGLASASRLWRAAADELVAADGVGVLNGRTSFVEAAYLPGGAAALALLAASPPEALLGHTDRAANWLALTADQRPALTIVVAAYPEEVQQWLELVQTERPLPVLAFTGAGADLVLRPYLASGQLRGLVSGFDGAAAYQQLRDRRFARLPAARYTEQLIAQNWGHFALLLILILGNLRVLWLGGDHD